MADTSWNPWRDLRGRAHVRLRIVELPRQLRAVYCQQGDRAAILLSDQLERCERRVELGHELLHEERGIAFTEDSPSGVRQKEEAIVRAELVRRLVPMAELDALAAAGEPLEVWQVAEHFDIPDDVARDACWRWWRARGL